MSKSFAVIGLGRFGKKLALSLYDMGAEVLAVDKSPEIVESVSGSVTYAIEADVSNIEAMKGIGINNMDAVVVAMGSDLTSSIMAVMSAKEQGVPKVVAKAADDLYLGVHEACLGVDGWPMRLRSETGSTKKDIKVEVCSKCHPFFTGKQKLVDTGGRVAKFNKKFGLG